MTTTIVNAESAFLTAQARQKRWQANFMRQWYAPMNDMLVSAWWASVPEAIKASLREANPEQVREVEKRIELLRSSSGG